MIFAFEISSENWIVEMAIKTKVLLIEKKKKKKKKNIYIYTNNSLQKAFARHRRQ